LSNSSVLAAEGSSLRGLKPPQAALTSATHSLISHPGLKWHAADPLPELAPRLTLYGATVENQRFNINGTSVRMSLQRPFGQSASFNVANSQPLLDIFPRYTLYRQVTQPLPGGWGLGFGVRQSSYAYATRNLYSVSAERYFGNFRGAYTLYSSRVDGNDLGSAQRMQLNYLYGERNTIGLAYTTGRDIDNLAMVPGLGIGDARDLTLSGRHWLSTNWALTYDLLSHEQGTLARRQGLRLGVSRSF
jgi:YaiO family outer membrane protein